MKQASTWQLESLPYETSAFSWFECLAGEPMAFLLESLGAEQQRYDIVGAAPASIVSAADDGVWIDGQLDDRDAFAAVAAAVDARRPSQACPLDCPFQGGAVGFFGYELSHGRRGIAAPPAEPGQLPDMLVGLYDCFILIDHARRQSHWLCSPNASPATARRLRQRMAQPAEPTQALRVMTDVRADTHRQEYNRSLAAIHAYVHAGDCYQVNFTQRFSTRYEGDPLSLYRQLRHRQQAPFSACLRQPGGDILSFSPERLVRLDGRRMLAQPIKGTRARHLDPAEDQRLAAELQNSEKDQAENLMIVDLLRNDLGRVAVPGTMAVDKLFELTSFANVHHLVSSISGELQTGLNAMDLLRACFPGGSVTGAPKHRAMQIIAELECRRREAYCGAIGYYSYHGNLDTNLPIRTLVCRDGRLHYWGGGGIVADSQTGDEYAESLLKVDFILSALNYLKQ